MNRAESARMVLRMVGLRTRQVLARDDVSPYKNVGRVHFLLDATLHPFLLLGCMGLQMIGFVIGLIMKRTRPFSKYGSIFFLRIPYTLYEGVGRQDGHLRNLPGRAFSRVSFH